MSQPQLDPWLQGLMLTLAAASLVAWLALLVRRTEKPFLRYEPRQPVPWGPAAALLAVFFVALPITFAVASGASAPRQEFEHPVRQIAMFILQQGLITGVFVVVIAVSSGASARDLGLPLAANQGGRGILIGLVAWLAALLPVQGAQVLLFSLLRTPSHHPLVDLVIDEPTPALMFLALVAAVVVAPICEEIVFRLLLQGWLEKWEDQQLGWRAAAQPTAPPQDASLPADPPVADVGIGPEAPPEADPPAPSAPPRRGLAGLPYGWAPILISSQLFGLAHYGHGTDPIPLFLLGIILGYTYQRTHRITACIVTHMGFNLLSMFVLWRAIETHAF